MEPHFAHLGRDGLREEGGRAGGSGGWRLGRVLGAGCACDGDVLHRNAVRGDVVDLAGRRHVDQVVGLHLDLVAGWKEGVEAHDEVGVSLEELRHPADDTRGVDAGDANTSAGSHVGRLLLSM